LSSEKSLSFDPLDDTKLWPVDQFPLLPCGRMVLDRVPDNFPFGEVAGGDVVVQVLGRVTDVAALDLGGLGRGQVAHAPAEIQGRDVGHATKDLYDNIAAGNFPEWEFAVQIFGMKWNLHRCATPWSLTSL
jgi:catalase